MHRQERFSPVSESGTGRLGKKNRSPSSNFRPGLDRPAVLPGSRAIAKLLCPNLFDLERPGGRITLRTL